MGAYYDSYDYPAYWKNREYEHAAEIEAIKRFLEKIPNIKTILEIGAGYGRLTSSYQFRAKKIILSDPSAKLLSIAHRNLKKYDKIEYLQSTLENLPLKIRKGRADLIILVRVLHHLPDINDTIEKIYKLLPDNGYFILEFANKSHLKALITEFFKGNFTYALDIFSKDLRSKKAKKENKIPFLNHHPEVVIQILKNQGFTILEKLSVSNIRYTIIKKSFSLKTLISLEKYLQKLFSFLNLGPSIFILAQKKG